MNKKVLVAEDDPSTREFVTEMLTLEGYEVHAVTNGRLAKEAVTSLRPHLAILDIMMPEEDGMSVLRCIRTESPTPNLPVILLTAKDDDSSTWEGWQAGCDLYLPKPFDPEELAAAVDRLMSAKEAV